MNSVAPAKSDPGLHDADPSLDASATPKEDVDDDDDYEEEGGAVGHKPKPKPPALQLSPSAEQLLKAAGEKLGECIAKDPSMDTVRVATHMAGDLVARAAGMAFDKMHGWDREAEAREGDTPPPQPKRPPPVDDDDGIEVEKVEPPSNYAGHNVTIDYDGGPLVTAHCVRDDGGETLRLAYNGREFDWSRWDVEGWFVSAPAAAPAPTAAPPSSPVPRTPPSKKQRVHDAGAEREQTAEEKAVEAEVNECWREEEAFQRRLSAEIHARRMAAPYHQSEEDEEEAKLV